MQFLTGELFAGAEVVDSFTGTEVMDSFTGTVLIRLITNVIRYCYGRSIGGGWRIYFARGRGMEVEVICEGIIFNYALIMVRFVYYSIGCYSGCSLGYSQARHSCGLFLVGSSYSFWLIANGSALAISLPSGRARSKVVVWMQRGHFYESESGM